MVKYGEMTPQSLYEVTEGHGFSGDPDVQDIQAALLIGPDRAERAADQLIEGIVKPLTEEHYTNDNFTLQEGDI